MTFNVLADVWMSYTRVNALSDVEAQLAAKPELAATVEQLRQERATLTDEKTRCATIARVVNEWKPDIVLLQEVQSSSFELLSKALYANYAEGSFAYNKVSSAKQRNGVAMFVSRDALTLDECPEVWLECGTSATGSDGSTAQLFVLMQQITESAGWVRAIPRCVIANVHLEYGKDVMTTQLQVLRGAINERRLRDVPLILAGDFNATRQEAIDALAATGFGALVPALGDAEPTTYVSGSNPSHTRQCDHIFVSGGGAISINGTRFHSMAGDIKDCMKQFGSDHTPVMATLQLA
jgi:endonuclease/exonuclease/phosphatase family metal-dependent hydrolase